MALEVFEQYPGRTMHQAFRLARGSGSEQQRVRVVERKQRPERHVGFACDQVVHCDDRQREAIRCVHNGDRRHISMTAGRRRFRRSAGGVPPRRSGTDCSDGRTARSAAPAPGARSWPGPPTRSSWSTSGHRPRRRRTPQSRPGCRSAPRAQRQGNRTPRPIGAALRRAPATRLRSWPRVRRIGSRPGPHDVSAGCAPSLGPQIRSKLSTKFSFRSGKNTAFSQSSILHTRVGSPSYRISAHSRKHAQKHRYRSIENFSNSA